MDSWRTVLQYIFVESVHFSETTVRLLPIRVDQGVSAGYLHRFFDFIVSSPDISDRTRYVNTFGLLWLGDLVLETPLSHVATEYGIWIAVLRYESVYGERQCKEPASSVVGIHELAGHERAGYSVRTPHNAIARLRQCVKISVARWTDCVMSRGIPRKVVCYNLCYLSTSEVLCGYTCTGDCIDSVFNLSPQVSTLPALDAQNNIFNKFVNIQRVFEMVSNGL